MIAKKTLFETFIVVVFLKSYRRSSYIAIMSSAVTRTLANRGSLIHQALWEPQHFRACTVFARFINLGTVESPKGALKESAKVASQAWASAQVDSAVLEAAANPPQGKLAIQKLLSKLKNGVSSAGKTVSPPK